MNGEFRNFLERRYAGDRNQTSGAAAADLSWLRQRERVSNTLRSPATVRRLESAHSTPEMAAELMQRRQGDRAEGGSSSHVEIRNASTPAPVEHREYSVNRAVRSRTPRDILDPANGLAGLVRPPERTHGNEVR